MVVVPYIYRPSHNLKQVIGQYGILVMFSAQQKISQVYARVHAGAEKRLQAKCTQKKKLCDLYIGCRLPDTPVVWVIFSPLDTNVFEWNVEREGSFS